MRRRLQRNTDHRAIDGANGNIRKHKDPARFIGGHRVEEGHDRFGTIKSAVVIIIPVHREVGRGTGGTVAVGQRCAEWHIGTVTQVDRCQGIVLLRIAFVGHGKPQYLRVDKTGDQLAGNDHCRAVADFRNQHVNHVVHDKNRGRAGDRRLADTATGIINRGVVRDRGTGKGTDRESRLGEHQTQQTNKHPSQVPYLSLHFHFYLLVS